jgi:hypothetical protein
MATTTTPVTSAHAGAHELRRPAAIGRRIEARTRDILLGFLVLLIAARVAAPYVIEEYIDRRLDALDGYTGDVEDVDLNLFRGAYRIEGMRISKTGGGAPVPFFSVRTIDLSVDWGALLHGKIVSEIDLLHPILNFVLEGRAKQTGAEARWPELVSDIVPLRVNRLGVHAGEVHYRAYDRSPEVDLYADRIALTAHDLSTEGRRETPLPSRLHMDARVQRSGRLVVDARLDTFASAPTFALAIRLRDLDARELDPFLRAYAGVDAEKGRFYLYSELRARGGRFEGYIKPMAEHLSVFQADEPGGFIDKVGDLAAQVVVEIFENHGNDTLAVDVPISGSFEDPEVSTWAVIVSALKNAFIEGLKHGLDDRSGWHTIGDEELRTGRAPSDARASRSQPDEG